MSVTDDFKNFKSNLTIDSDKRDSVSYRYRRITKQLNKDFHDLESDSANSRYVGSYGRKTAISGFSDLDMLFTLPYSDYLRFDGYNGNGQSALLAEFRDSIKSTYPSSSISGDGQVVVVNFEDGIKFEILPAFKNTDDSFTYPNSNDGGSWKVTNPLPEIKAVQDKDDKTNHNMKDLAKMTRAWKKEWSVPISGLLIDTLVHNFLSSWQYSGKDELYYDFMTRDFFEYLASQNQNQDFWYALGSNQKVYRIGLFEYKAKRCYNISLEAVSKYSDKYEASARTLMRQIYGSKFPN